MNKRFRSTIMLEYSLAKHDQTVNSASRFIDADLFSVKNQWSFKRRAGAYFHLGHWDRWWSDKRLKWVNKMIGRLVP